MEPTHQAAMSKPAPQVASMRVGGRDRGRPPVQRAGDQGPVGSPGPARIAGPSKRCTYYISGQHSGPMKQRRASCPTVGQPLESRAFACLPPCGALAIHQPPPGQNVECLKPRTPPRRCCCSGTSTRCPASRRRPQPRWASWRPMRCRPTPPSSASGCSRVRVQPRLGYVLVTSPKACWCQCSSKVYPVCVLARHVLWRQGGGSGMPPLTNSREWAAQH